MPPLHALLALLALGLCASCTANQTLTVPAPTIDEANVVYTSKQPIVLVISNQLFAYEYTVDVPNWAWGVVAKDTLHLQVGRSVASALKGLCEQVFTSVEVVPSIEGARGTAPPRSVVVPEIVGANLQHPLVRWAQITAEVTVVYHVYRPDGSARQLKIKGVGTHRLHATKGNHALAFRDAVRDLVANSAADLVRLVSESGGDPTSSNEHPDSGANIAIQATAAAGHSAAISSRDPAAAPER